MRPRRGSTKRTMVDGTMMTWGEYCLKYYGVGHDWINRLLKGEHTQDSAEVDSKDEEEVDSREGLEQTTEPHLSKKDRIIVDLQKQNDELTDQNGESTDLISKMESGDQTPPAATATEEDANDEPVVPTMPVPDPYRTEWDQEFMFSMALSYFQSIKNPTSFASDIDAIIRKCGMSEYITTVMTEAAEV
jgi:hypothetical protein